jgi:Family of unknown function (DUF6065)
MAVIAFHELVRNSRPPIRATKNAAGQLPDRHHRCEPVRTASGLGWYVFLPLDFQLVFDGVEAIISLDEGENWYPLSTLQYPDFVAHFNEHAPTEAQGFAPPFIAMTEDPGIVQIWTGYIVKTAPDYSLLVRSPANILATQGYHHFEGVIETDRWFGPLFTNIKLLRTDAPIHFHAHRPFLQLTPIHRAHYADALLNDFEVHDGFGGFKPEDWEAYQRTVVKPNADPFARRVGAYAVAARKRRAQEE